MFAQRILKPAASLTRRSFFSTTQQPTLGCYRHRMAAPTSLVSASSTVNNSLFSMASIALNNWKETGIRMISTLKRRRKMMNKHKLRKRRKKNRMKNKK